jgi:nitrogen-specific signal transduction histidine kinase/CheY-like chemotaxis protein
LALIQDITEQKKAEEEKEILRDQLFLAQKMESIGTLAGGIAHDFNNLLQAISGYSELLLMNPKQEEKTVTGLNRINQAARNGAALVKGLLTLSGRMESQPKPINVNHQVDEVVKLLSRTIPKVIELESYLDDALPLINGDPVQVHQVLMNLGINARDAMQHGGRLVFETSGVTLDETYCKTRVAVEPGTYVLLSVSDTGTGMDQETAAHIFEPFFTTKPVGAGTGLGLSIVYGIVKQHGGAIRCYSEPGRGTTFKVYFPIIEETVELSEEVSRDPLPPGGTETILLVDDDQVVRELAETMLVEMGYTALIASNGKDAVERYRIDRENISLVILDLIMPKMDGPRCLREILRIDSSARVLIASGHAENGLVKETIERGARGFVHKPYDVRQLLQKVRDVLDHE